MERVAKSLCDCAIKLKAVKGEDTTNRKDIKTKIIAFENELRYNSF